MNIFSKQQNKMQEVENPDFARRPPAVICDVELPNIPEPFPNKSFHMAFVGRPGFGKTSLAINLIAEKTSGHRCYYRKFDEVYVMMPKGSLASLKDNPFESLPADNIYNDFTLENLYDLEMKLEENAEEDPPKLSLLPPSLVHYKLCPTINHHSKKCSCHLLARVLFQMYQK
jgi:hypothetical protein